ncbi:hypothetical protein F8M41_022395 [Gigaspora margarita]|uniref:Uncharacterized protein n=1 Tax=Gigaspora margarita TaxID=4874 RepID=A0A8H4AF36_GIGMA|nr:hypothetical protein F8M41_022395 [Gigaspora margarita]
MLNQHKNLLRMIPQEGGSLLPSSEEIDVLELLPDINESISEEVVRDKDDDYKRETIYVTEFVTQSTFAKCSNDWQCDPRNYLHMLCNATKTKYLRFHFAL